MMLHFLLQILAGKAGLDSRWIFVLDPALDQTKMVGVSYTCVLLFFTLFCVRTSR